MCLRYLMLSGSCPICVASGSADTPDASRVIVAVMKGILLKLMSSSSFVLRPAIFLSGAKSSQGGMMSPFHKILFLLSFDFLSNY
jgi:hypothetical protein